MIKFREILFEIGINNPNKIKAERVGEYVIKIGHFRFQDGDVYVPRYPNYWYITLSKNVRGYNNFVQWSSFKLFEKLGQRGHDVVVFGISKDKVIIQS